MFCHSTTTASFLSVVIAALIFWLSLAGVAAAQQGNTSLEPARSLATPRAPSTPQSGRMLFPPLRAGRLQHRDRGLCAV